MNKLKFLISHRLPYCGDSIPNALIFFRDSQIIAAFLLLETIAIKSFMIKTNDLRPYLWIQSTVTMATTNRVGEFLLTPTTNKVEDATDLVESVKRLSSDEIVWTTFYKLIERVLLFAFLILYFFMIISLLPEGYLSATYDPIESMS